MATTLLVGKAPHATDPRSATREREREVVVVVVVVFRVQSVNRGSHETR